LYNYETKKKENRKKRQNSYAQGNHDYLRQLQIVVNHEQNCFVADVTLLDLQGKEMKLVESWQPAVKLVLLDRR
jgi:hypothetical protein